MQELSNEELAAQTVKFREQLANGATLDDLLAHHVVVAPPGSPENVAPPAGTKPPFAIFASNGGIQYTRKMYRDAAHGHPATLIQSCRANGPVGTR